MDSCCTQNWGILSLYARLFSNCAKKMEHFKLSQGDLPFWPTNTKCLPSRRYLSLPERLFNLRVSAFDGGRGGRSMWSPSHESRNRLGSRFSRFSQNRQAFQVRLPAAELGNIQRTPRR